MCVCVCVHFQTICPPKTLPLKGARDGSGTGGKRPLRSPCCLQLWALFFPLPPWAGPRRPACVAEPRCCWGETQVGCMAGVFLSAVLQLLFGWLAVFCFFFFFFFFLLLFYDSFQQKGEQKAPFCRTVLPWYFCTGWLGVKRGKRGSERVNIIIVTMAICWHLLCEVMAVHAFMYNEFKVSNDQINFWILKTVVLSE